MIEDDFGPDDFFPPSEPKKPAPGNSWLEDYDEEVDWESQQSPHHTRSFARNVLEFMAFLTLVGLCWLIGSAAFGG